MKRLAARLSRDTRGGPAAEFALVLPLLLMFLLGIIDVGRLMWTWNRAEKATQMGVRYAVATNLVLPSLGSYSFASQGGLPQGDPISSAVFGGVGCNATKCGDTSGTPDPDLVCSGSICGSLGMTRDAAAFTNIVARMRAFFPEIAPANVKIRYDYSGLGYAGDPNGPDVAPLVIVKLNGMTFRPLLLMLFGGSITLPDFRAALTLEDGAGTVSN